MDHIREIEKYKKMKETVSEKYELANKWLHLQNKRISVIKRLHDKGIEKIILYGASEFALRFLEQCENERDLIKVTAISDKKISGEGGYYKEIPLIAIDDIRKRDMANACVVITAMGFYEEIKAELQERGVVNIISLRDLVDEACMEI